MIVTPVIAPVDVPQSAEVTVVPLVSATGSGLKLIVTCDAGLVQDPIVSVTQNDVVAVTPDGRNGFALVMNVVKPASEYQLMVPPALVAVTVPTVEPTQYAGGVITGGAIGNGVMVSNKLSYTAPQAPAGSSDVKYSITEPATVSAAEGV